MKFLKYHFQKGFKSLKFEFMLVKISKTYDPGHNILELYNALIQMRFSTSKKKLHI